MTAPSINFDSSDNPAIEHFHKQRAEIRVKIKSLAEEARIIRSEEAKALARSRDPKQADRSSLRARYRELYTHRILTVRPAARATQLAYAFLRGRPYRACEAKTHEPIWYALGEIVKNAKRFSGLTTEALEPAIREWLMTK